VQEVVVEALRSKNEACAAHKESDESKRPSGDSQAAAAAAVAQCVPPCSARQRSFSAWSMVHWLYSATSLTSKRLPKKAATSSSFSV
jgi:hypothetical protein